jgi:hypothetical protein
MRVSESNAQLTRLSRRLRSYFAVVAVPRGTERSSRVSRSRNIGDSLRRLFEAARSTDRTQRYRKRYRYTRTIAVVIEFLIRMPSCRLIRLGQFSFRFLRFEVYHAVSFSCADRSHLMANILVDAIPRFWNVQRVALAVIPRNRGVSVPRSATSSARRRAILRKLPFGSAACAVERGSIGRPLCISACVDLGPCSPRFKVIEQSTDARRPARRSLRALLAS